MHRSWHVKRTPHSFTLFFQEGMSSFTTACLCFLQFIGSFNNSTQLMVLQHPVQTMSLSLPRLGAIAHGPTPHKTMKKAPVCNINPSNHLPPTHRAIVQWRPLRKRRTEKGGRQARQTLAQTTTRTTRDIVEAPLTASDRYCTGDAMEHDRQALRQLCWQCCEGMAHHIRCRFIAMNYEC